MESVVSTPQTDPLYSIIQGSWFRLYSREDLVKSGSGLIYINKKKKK